MFPPRMTKALELDSPPELLYVMKSIADFDKKWNEQTPITKLAEVTKHKLFYDTYPLSANVNKDEFEINILNHFIRERSAFDTVTGFKIALINKLREIMPKYNLMFDLIAKELELFNTNHERDLREETDDDFSNRGNLTKEEVGNYHKEGTKVSDTDGTNSHQANTTEEGAVNSHIVGEKLEDLRYSDTPQNALADVRSGSYVSEYHYNDTDTEETKEETSEKETNLNESGTNHTDYDEGWDDDGNDTRNTNQDTTDTGERDILKVLHETYKTADNLVDKMALFNEIPAIMTMIYNDLDCLFLQVYDY